MRTFPRNTGKSAALGDYPAECDYCGSLWLRSALYIDAEGLSRCPRHKGEDPVALEEANRALQSQYSLKLNKDTSAGENFQGSYEGTSDLAETLWEEAHGQPFTDPLA